MRKKFSVLFLLFFTAYAKNVIQKNFSNTFSQKNAEKTTTFRYLKLKASLYQLAATQILYNMEGNIKHFLAKTIQQHFCLFNQRKVIFFFKLWHFKVVLSTLTQICSSLNVKQKWVMLIYESYRYITTMKMHWNIANVMLCKDFAKNSTQ